MSETKNKENKNESESTTKTQWVYYYPKELFPATVAKIYLINAE